MFNKLDKRIRYAVGITFIMGSLFGGLIGYDLKNIGGDKWIDSESYEKNKSQGRVKLYSIKRRLGLS